MYGQISRFTIAVGYTSKKFRFYSSYPYFLRNSIRIPNLSTKIVSKKNSGFAPTKTEKYEKMYIF